MFSFIDKTTKTEGSGAIARIQYGDKSLVRYESWGFASCGVDHLYSFNSHSDFWKDKEKVTALITWLGSNSPGGGWNPLNYMFAITDEQVSRMPALVNHFLVKQVDEFINDAHGPNKIMVYRISANRTWWKGYK